MMRYELIDSNIGRDQAKLRIWDMDNERDLNIDVEFSLTLGDNGMPVPMDIRAFDADAGLELSHEDLLDAVELWLARYMDNCPDVYIGVLEESAQERAYTRYRDLLIERGE